MKKWSIMLFIAQRSFYGVSISVSLTAKEAVCTCLSDISKVHSLNMNIIQIKQQKISTDEL